MPLLAEARRRPSLLEADILTRTPCQLFPIALLNGVLVIVISSNTFSRLSGDTQYLHCTLKGVVVDHRITSIGASSCNDADVPEGYWCSAYSMPVASTFDGLLTFNPFPSRPNHQCFLRIAWSYFRYIDSEKCYSSNSNTEDFSGLRSSI